jgi:predicted small lipoprotein YifL
MDTKRISVVSGTALLALTATGSAGPMSVPSSNVIAPPQTQTEPVAYRYRPHYRHYGGYHHRYYRRYGWNPGAAVAGAALGLATIPFALATGGYYGYYPYYGYYGPSYYYY